MAGIEPPDAGTPFVYDASLPPDDPAVPEVLAAGRIDVLGVMPWSSNATFLVRVDLGAHRIPAVYKPERGERPLWDFPGGLWRREVAASVLSDHLGFGLVPTTVRREDAPIGVGSLQVFVPADFSEHYFTMRDRSSLSPVLRRLCAFDVVINSADRKAGHCLLDDRDRVWAIDNGLAFHAEPKVRTVIWDFAGEPLPDDVRRSLATMLDGPLPPSLDELLAEDERVALRDRSCALLSTGRFPHDPSGRRVPWPLV